MWRGVLILASGSINTVALRLSEEEIASSQSRIQVGSWLSVAYRTFALPYDRLHFFKN